jgi:hypothetical protein
LSPRSASRATVALNLSEKFRLFIILVSIRSCWIHLSTLSKFAGPLQRSGTSRALAFAEALLWQNKKLQKSENKLSKSANNA